MFIVARPNGLMDQDVTCYGGRPRRPTRHCVRCGPSYPQKKGTPSPTNFLAHVYVYCGQMARWMKTPLGTEVDLGEGRIVLDGVPAPAKEAQPPLFWAHVYCGHGRPSQLLLSSCCLYTTRNTVHLIRFWLASFYGRPME